MKKVSNFLSLASDKVKTIFEYRMSGLQKVQFQGQLMRGKSVDFPTKNVDLKNCLDATISNIKKS